MTPVNYITAVRSLLNHLEGTQLRTVDRAARLAVRALKNRGAVFCAGVGHGIEGDFINRAGGLAAVQRFSYGFSVNSPVAKCLAPRPRACRVHRETEEATLAVRTGNLRRGDVIVIGSVSGKTSSTVALALACRKAGIKVIALTSLEYTAKVKSDHPSGRRLCDVADVVVDNGVPYGDAAVKIPGLRERALPLSGVACAVAGWMIWGRVMELMAAGGTPPTTFISVNRDGGQKHYKRSRARFERKGY